MKSLSEFLTLHSKSDRLWSTVSNFFFRWSTNSLDLLTTHQNRNVYKIRKKDETTWLRSCYELRSRDIFGDNPVNVVEAGQVGVLDRQYTDKILLKKQFTWNSTSSNSCFIKWRQSKTNLCVFHRKDLDRHHIKGTDESPLGKDWLTHLMYHDLSDLGWSILILIVPMTMEWNTPLNFRCVALSAKEGACCKDMSRTTISRSSPVCVSISVHVSVLKWLNKVLLYIGE